ncbi:competence type IV pilus minor pilin ComGE [Peribacillus frigoritolerans]|uniref:competence type IV pilus minor pilin ComGE n=1 Tax=Peribacillus frigoritolerans TaxID=450367 RepID=UPI00105A40F2|nr:competence type IV pilus minor pilin ComGE [Peribacillus frigoritolerans]TDL82317.1 type II secretion system protein [Peribacillus frigoritolerans]
MLKGCNGFTMAEILMAFSIWSMISLMLLPASVYLKKEREENKIKHEALVLLKDHIETLNFENRAKENLILSVKNQRFEIIWSKEEGIDQACIKWESQKDAEAECLYSF